MTETAAMADIVLPATTFLEHDDIYVASGHTYVQVTKAVIEPLPGCRSNHEVLCGLAKRLGAEHPGFAMSAWEIVDATLRATRLPDAPPVYEAAWHPCLKPSARMNFLTGLGRPHRRFHLLHIGPAMGCPF